jgi:hypothetical protein
LNEFKGWSNLKPADAFDEGSLSPLQRIWFGFSLRIDSQAGCAHHLNPKDFRKSLGFSLQTVIRA